MTSTKSLDHNRKLETEPQAAPLAAFIRAGRELKDRAILKKGARRYRYYVCHTARQKVWVVLRHQVSLANLIEPPPQSQLAARTGPETRDAPSVLLNLVHGLAQARSAAVPQTIKVVVSPPPRPMRVWIKL